MSETTKNSGDKLSVTPTKTLTLKRSSVEQGVVRQSFSHGRSKAVVVEKVKRRVPGPGEAKAEPAAPERGTAVKRAGAPLRATGSTAATAPSAAPAAAPKASGVVLRTLTDDERMSAGAPRKKPRSAARARKPTVPSARRRKRASVKKKSAASMMRKHGAKPTKLQKSASAPIPWLESPAPVRH